MRRSRALSRAALGMADFETPFRRISRIEESVRSAQNSGLRGGDQGRRTRDQKQGRHGSGSVATRLHSTSPFPAARHRQNPKIANSVTRLSFVPPPGLRRSVKYSGWTRSFGATYTPGASPSPVRVSLLSISAAYSKRVSGTNSRFPSTQPVEGSWHSLTEGMHHSCPPRWSGAATL